MTAQGRYPREGDDNDAALVQAGRAWALLLALFWGFFPGFGLIDLETAIPPGDPEFRTLGFWRAAGECSSPPSSRCRCW